MSTNTTIPPIPIQTPVIDKNGIMTTAWNNFFKQLYLRAGGSDASSISIIESTITTMETNITSLQTSVTSLTSSLSSLTDIVNGLSQGRQL